MKQNLGHKFRKLFQKRHTVRDFIRFRYNVQFKRDMEIRQQEGRRVPIHIQKSVETELTKLSREGHIDKLDHVGKNVFVSPAVITRKSDGSLKFALDSVELNNQILRKRKQFPMLAELLDQVLMKVMSKRNKPLIISTMDPKYAFGHISLNPETAKHCVGAIVSLSATAH